LTEKREIETENETGERERERERAGERERERESLDTLIPGVPLNLYSLSFFVTIKHTLPHNRQTHIHRDENIEIQRET
jgi:hypothetical protein